MLRLTVKKSQFIQNLKLKKQKHPWDMIEELAKAKTLEKPARTHEVAFDFSEQTSSLLSEIPLTPHEVGLEQNLEDNLHLLEEPEEPCEGFFPCPACTCWFSNKKDLDFHIKRWCDR